MERLRNRLSRAFGSDFPADSAVGFWLVVFDLLLPAYFLTTTFVDSTPLLRGIDFALGVILAVEWLARLWVARDRLAFLGRPLVLVDLAIILSLLVPALAGKLIFLRVLRTLRLLRSYRLLYELRSRSAFFRRTEEVWFSAIHLLAFVFLISSVVYVLQADRNPQITNYVDALYFTVTALTTTGFGDITLTGSTGRLLAIIIMLVGLSLFLRLLQAVFRPTRIQHECPDCGLNRHDRDAVHCKHCGRLLHISTEGLDGND
ncbi:MAG: potassium channel family protein [Wenzhouxiangellaceae bacterium]